MSEERINPFANIPAHLWPRAAFVWAQLLALWLRFKAFGDPDAEIYFEIDDRWIVRVVSAPEGFMEAQPNTVQRRLWLAPLRAPSRRPAGLSGGAPRLCTRQTRIAPVTLQRLSARARDGPAPTAVCCEHNS